MQDPILSCKISHQKYAGLAGAFLAFSLLCFVIFGVVVAVEWEYLDRSMWEEKNLTYFLIGGIILIVPAIYLRVAYTQKAVLEIYQQHKGLSISVVKEGQSLLTIQPGFTVEGVWFLEELGRYRVKYRDLYLTFFEHGEPVLTITRRISFEDDPPEHFRHIEPLKINVETGEGKPRLAQKKDRYACRKLLEVNEMVRGSQKE